MGNVSPLVCLLGELGLWCVSEESPLKGSHFYLAYFLKFTDKPLDPPPPHLLRVAPEPCVNSELQLGVSVILRNFHCLGVGAGGSTVEGNGADRTG
jgi:hypothetical protein